MRKLLTIVFVFITITFASAQCKIDVGKIIAQPIGNHTYKLYLNRKPVNTCFPVPDSSALWVGVLCQSTGNYESVWLKWSDTLVYQFHGKIIVAAKIRWFNNGNGYAETHIDQVPYIQEPNGLICFNRITTTPVVPAPFIPDITAEAGNLVTNTGGTLILLSYPDFFITIIKSYSQAFSYTIPQGWWYYYLILPNGQTIGNEIIQN